MLNSKVFNVQSPMIPFTKRELEHVIAKHTCVGYVSTNYSNLIETLQSLSKAKQVPVTLNINTLYNSTNNPIDKKDVLIKVEGTQTFDEFINNVIQGDEDSDYMSFITYSVLFKDAVKNLKFSMYKKYLWNYHNIDNWFTSNNIGLTSDFKNSLVNDFDFFTKNILLTNDYLTFTDSCREDDLLKACKYLVNGGLQLLNKFKVELNNHIHRMNRSEEQIILKNPIILKIYMLSGAATMCRKDWPRIKFDVLDKKSLDSIALWEK